MVRDANIDDLLGIARVQVETWRSTYRGMIDDDVLDSLDVNVQAKKFSDFLPEKNGQTFLLVAEAARQIVGFAAGGVERERLYGIDGEVYAVYVLKEYQSQGIGVKLMRRASEKLAGMVLTSMLVWVLERNTYKKFYEKHGGRQIDRKALEKDGSEPVIAAYAWHDLKGF